MLFDYVWRATPVLNLSTLWKWGVPLALLSSLLYAFNLSGNSRLERQLAGLPKKNKSVSAQVAFLKAQPGLAICESLLRCYDAGKPYIYDPAGSDNLMNFNMLDRREIITKIEMRQFGAIQLKSSIESLNRPNNHFPDEVLDAVSRYYAPSLKDPDCYIYLPKPVERNELLTER